MATLVLTAVGGAIGGPIGAAIGSAIGQYVDRDILFAPKGREGPRLTELALQTSSYGTQVPLLFGTIRVAGTVIWSTDLIESRSRSRSGKGQPSVTTYSYSASFAVLLSARPIAGVGRIWADGNLLRGSAGDFKSATGFCLHTGGEDQPPDPLIASAEAATPAYRGGAYAVFEGMQLAAYGNRIPSLTFEVFADPGTVAASAIAAAVAPEVAGATSLAIGGFAASGTVRGVLDVLGQAAGAWFAADGAALVMRDAPGAVTTIDDAGYATDARGTRRTRAIAALDGVPRTITLAHYDPARDYQTSVQRALRPGAGVKADAVDMPAVLAADVAKGLAEAMLLRADIERTTRSIAAGMDAMAVAPGDCVAIAGEPGTWRVRRASVEAMVTKLDLVALAPGALPVAASAGRVLAASDATIGATLLAVFETPALDDPVLGAPRLSIAANGAGAGWRQAALLYSIDDGASWIAAGGTAAPAVIGVVETAPPPAPATLYDTAGAFVVRLARGDMDLGDADDAALDRGANLAAIGDALVQFGRAEPLGGGRWRLTRLLHGRRGTEDAVPVAGDRFVLIDADTVRPIDLPVSAIGRGVRVLASGVGDPTPVEARLTLGGRSVLPPAPAHLRLDGDGGGDVIVRWVRRSRAGWRWIDGVDAPLAEESEAYRVTLTPPSGEARSVDVAAPMLAIAAADRAQGLAIAVRQRGTFGGSPAATIAIPPV